MPAGTAVAVVVGKQQTTVPVPDVVGQDADDAQRELEEAGFTVRSTSVDGGNEGEVASTDPAAGTQAAAKSTVTMRVFSGDSNSVDMPDVRGETARAGPGHTGRRRASPTSGCVSESTNDPSDAGTRARPVAVARPQHSTDDQITLTVGTAVRRAAAARGDPRELTRPGSTADGY